MTRKTLVPTAVRRRVPDAIRRSYLAKFSILLLAVVIVTATVGGYTYLSISNDLRGDVQHELETVATLESGDIATWARERRQTTRMLSKYDAMTSNSPSLIDATLWNEMQSFPDDVTGAYYVDTTTGEVVASSAGDMEGTAMTDVLPWSAGELSFTDDDQVRMSQPYSVEGSSSIAFVSPIPADPDRAAAIVVNGSAVASRFRTPIDGTVTRVVNADGDVVLSMDRSEIMTPYADGKGVDAMGVKRGLRGKSGVLEMDGMRGTLDEKHVMAYTPIEGTGWVLLLHTPTRTAYATVSDATVNIAGLILAVLLCLGFIGLTLGRTTVREIRGAADSAESIARGDLDAEVEESDRIDEIGALKQSFVEMRAYLNTVAAQADALAAQRFDDPVLEEDVPGEFGRTLAGMREDLEALITDIERAKEEAERLQLDAERATERSEELNAALERKATEFGAVMERAAAGDLTGRMDPEGESEAMADIAEAFNDMVAELGSTIQRIQRFAEEVDAASEGVTAGASEVEGASEEVSTSVQQISAGSTEQSENLQQVSGEMTDLSATVEEIAASADEVATTSRRAAAAGETGSASAADAIDEMTEIERETEGTVDEIEDLHDEMAAIGDIVELIDDIATQTNLLALNANIEAARAGEVGEGFAVVADEIKSLAEETGEATERIERLIGGVQDSTGEAVEDIRHVSDRITDGVETVGEALDALDSVVDHVEDADHGIQSINEATDEQAASTEEVVAMVDEVASISEESAAEAETVSAAAEEQTAAIGEVSRSTEALSERANDLNDLLDRFEVGESRAEAATSAPIADGGTDTETEMQFGTPESPDERTE